MRGGGGIRLNPHDSFAIAIEIEIEIEIEIARDAAYDDGERRRPRSTTERPTRRDDASPARAV